MEMRYVFGPVMSGRLGRSLGIDPLGRAICSQDCLYCEAGATRVHTVERKVYAPKEAILAELKAWAKAPHPPLDYATLGGLGEPTLSSDMGVIIEEIRKILPGTPVAVLTNSSTLTNPDVLRELCLADVVLPSLDTLVPGEYSRLNRPVAGLGPETIAEGLLALRRSFAGKIFLEVLLAEGFNDSEENLKRIKEFCVRLAPERVDVETLTRPGASPEARAVRPETLALWREALGVAGEAPRAREQEGQERRTPREGLQDMILASTARRPQSAEQLALALGARLEDVELAVRELVHAGLAEEARRDATTFYRAAHKA